MYMIHSLEIENYKSIEKISASFGEVNALIGKNGAGKTTLISAINIIKNLAKGLNVNDVINEVAPLGEFFNCNSNSRKSSFALKIQTPARELFLYRFSISFGERMVKSGHIFFFSDESLHKLDGPDDNSGRLVFRRTSDDDSTIEVGDWDGRSSKIEKIPLQVDPSILVLSSYAHKYARAVAGTLASYSVIWIDENDLYNRRSPIVSSNNLDLNTIDGVAVDLYMNNRHDYDEAIQTIKQIIPGFKPPRITRIEKDESEMDKHGGIYNFLVSWFDSNYAGRSSISRVSLSGGNSRVIYLILSLYNSKSNTCFVAEEIENGMHLSRISKLIDQLRMIIKNRKIQLFFTTHNHLILEDLLPREVIYVKLTDRGSVYTKLSETKEYQDIATALGRVPSSTEIINSGLLF